MVLLWIVCFPLLFFFNSFSFKLPQMKIDKRFFFSLFFLDMFASYLVSWYHKKIFFTYQVSDKKTIRIIGLKETENRYTCFTDLPELAMDCILERLSPVELCSMAGVCSSLREQSVSNHLWVKHLNNKWGRLIGDVALKEWQWRISSRKRPVLEEKICDHKSLLSSLGVIRPFFWIKPEFEGRTKTRTCLADDSIMGLYLSLEKGKFWFPAQVYNRENGHVGFLLSCYDAQMSYDCEKDTFQARYSPYGRRMIEENIKWNRIRAPPVNTTAHHLHISDCLYELRPGHHIEVQWRRSTEFPYGWWYAVVGHMESCYGNEHHCSCHSSDIVVLEFKQYPHGSRWRQTIINRKEHKEEGNEADGYYGGIRRLQKEEEISRWKQLCPNEDFE